MALFRTYQPQLPLAKFVNMFWLNSGYTSTHEMERILPDGSMELIINLEDDQIKIYDQKNQNRFKSFKGSVISGAYSDFTVIDTACQASTIGVHFKPGGAYPFLKVPASEFHNHHVSINEFWGTEASEIREQILEAKTPMSKFIMLENFLLKRLNDTVQHPAVNLALKYFQKIPQEMKVSDVTEQIGLSSRRFIQVFKEEIGLTPKQYIRIQRFQNVLRLIREQEEVNWTDLAVICGYYDQSHFINDFQSISGISPKNYSTQQSNQQNHVPLS